LYNWFEVQDIGLTDWDFSEFPQDWLWLGGGSQSQQGCNSEKSLSVNVYEQIRTSFLR